MNKLTVVQINTFSYKATGTIMLNLHQAMLEKGINSYVVWGRGRKSENEHEISMEDKVGIAWHGLYSRITDRTGFASARATKKLLRKLDTINPDIVHLHNIHGYYINIELLFEWLKATKTKTIWTLHDCWPLTGHCAYFDAIGCQKWKTGCSDCSQLKTYPKSIRIDNSKRNWIKKKELMTGLNLSIVTPCEWLKGIIKQSYLKDYPVTVINNGIDLNIFHPVKGKFKQKYNIVNKVMILGVASEWTTRKGLDDFIKMSFLLEENKYQIVLVGLTKKQLQSLPANIIGITRTGDIKELVDIYSSTDYFFNPTYEDNYPTTNLEAIACGTKVLTYRTGGSPESINDNIGVIFEKGDIKSIKHYLEISNGKADYQINYAEVLNFDKKVMITKYLKIFER